MNMEKPLVSILINAYNEERYIRDAIDSALAQTCPNIEVVILDDGSSDATPEIIRSYTDQRVRHVRPAKRLGIIEGRNELLRTARGVYLTYLDADDIYEPSKVASEVDFLETHKEYAAVYCGMAYFFDGAPDRLYHHRYEFYSGDHVFERLLEKMFITNTAVMWRQEVAEKLGPYRTDLGIVEDWEYFLRMTYAGHRIGFIDQDLVRYRLRWDSHTNFGRQVEVQHSAVRIFEELKRRMSEEDRVRYRIAYWIARRKERYAIALIGAGQGSEARKELRAAAPHISLARMAALVAFSFVPGSLVGQVLETAWKFKKKNLFRAV